MVNYGKPKSKSKSMENLVISLKVVCTEEISIVPQVSKKKK